MLTKGTENDRRRRPDWTKDAYLCRDIRFDVRIVATQYTSWGVHALYPLLWDCTMERESMTQDELEMLLRYLFISLCLIFMVMALFGCAPSIKSITAKGINCKAQITMPNRLPGETVTVKVKIYECEDSRFENRELEVTL